MKTPYLIQRCMLDTETKELKGRLTYDYMGSAEFEFGALPKALKELFSLGEIFISYQNIYPHGQKGLCVRLIHSASQSVSSYPLKALAEDGFRLKERSNFDTAVKIQLGEQLGKFEYHDPNINVWFDIENLVFFTLEDKTARLLVEQLDYIRKMWSC